MMQDWLLTLKALEKGCPWPGPRPFVADDDPRLLVGRDKNIEDFRREVDAHRLILLTGETGVGKSSLLQAGLIPRLEGSGYKVAICRDWGEESNNDPEPYLAAKVFREFAKQLPNLTDSNQVFWDLEAQLGSQTVIVLDQFEELIRYDPNLTNGIFALLLDINSETKLKVVLSFRSEYLHWLRPIENGARPFTISRFILDEVEPRLAAEVVKAANLLGVDAISDEAAELVAEVWFEARGGREGGVADGPLGQIGLLHLQALLYALHAEAHGGRIEVEAVKKMQGGGDALSLFTGGLLSSINVKVERCRDAARRVSGDDCLVEGTTQTLARCVRHLSSAGYKLVREAEELALATLSPEIEMLTAALADSGKGGESGEDGKLDAGQFAALFNVLLEGAIFRTRRSEADLLSTLRPELAHLADDDEDGPFSRPWLERLHEGEQRSDVADPREMSSGPMLGQSPAAVLVEEIRRFAFALAWLEESTLVRMSTPGGGSTKVTLIHDGFGNALLRWSQEAMDSPTGAIYALTSQRGLSFDWRWDHFGEERNWPDLTGDSAPRVLVNLRWRGGRVCSRMQHVVFANCDLRGSYFDSCIMRGVTFVNCLLDGVVFSDCEIAGSYVAASGDWTAEDMQFLLISPDLRVTQTLAKYQNLMGPSDAVLSSYAGMPAVAVDSGYQGAIPLQSSFGGVIISGGRLSSFILRSCQFPDNGGVSFRHVSGSGCDIVEHVTGSFEFFSSALRQIVFTTPSNKDTGTLSVEARGCILADVWIGDSLKGSFSAIDCRLIHIWNGSEQLTFTAKGSTVHGLVNVAVDESDRSLAKGDVFELRKVDPEGQLVEDARIMDYRRDPAFEHTRRSK